MENGVYNNSKFHLEVKALLDKLSVKNIFFVCSSEYDRYGYRKYIEAFGFNITAFTEFEPCPEISSVKKAVSLFKNGCYDVILAVGGGSAIDVAKGIKYYSKSDTEIIAIPTTAGTGAEVTRFAVLYNNGDKASVRSYDIIPEYQIFDYTCLNTLPHIQRIVTGLDAFTHAVEAYWSKNATRESRDYSKKSLKLFNECFMSYISGCNDDNEKMMKCSELAGRAINIAETTAAHAFSYKLHKLKGFYHGQAVAVCLVYIWRYMLENSSDDKLNGIFKKLNELTDFTPDNLEKFLDKSGLLNDLTVSPDEFAEIINGVDCDRLSNHPYQFDNTDIEKIYSSFLRVVK